MDHLELLERLNAQVEKLIDELTQTRTENARLAEELLDCRSESDNRAELLSNQQEELNLQHTEIEGLLGKIGGVLEAQQEYHQEEQHHDEQHHEEHRN